MSVWNNKGFTENELSKPAKILVGSLVGLLLIYEAILAGINATRGEVRRPWAGLVILLGFLLFLIPKLYVIRQKRRFSIGTRLMTQRQANSYRIGYFLMAAGFLLTFR